MANSTASVPKPFESTDSFVVKALLRGRLDVPNIPDAKPLVSESARLILKSGQLHKELNDLPNLKYRRDQVEANINLLRATKQQAADNFAKSFLTTDEKFKRHEDEIRLVKDNAIKNKSNLWTELRSIFEKLGKASKPSDVSKSQDVMNIFNRQREELKKIEHGLRMAQKDSVKLGEELNMKYKEIIPELPPERQRALAAETPKLLG